MPGRIIKNLAIAFASFAATAGLCRVSHALGVHEGFPARQLMQKLDAEHQKVMVIASQTVVSPTIKDIAILYTLDREGGSGYILESDRGTNEPGGTFHVVAHYNSAYLNFNRVAPPALLAGTDPVVATQQCDTLVQQGKLGKGSCYTLNDAVANGARAGERVLLWGISDQGAKIIVSGDVEDSDGSPVESDNGAGALEFSSLQGATNLGRPLHQVMTTDDFADFISRRGK